LFRFVLLCFETVCFSCFASISKQRVSMFGANRNKQKTNRNSLIERIFWYFSENFWLFRFVSVCFETILFVLVVWIQVRNIKTSRNKQKFFVFGFMKQTETQLKQILGVSVCYSSNRIFCFEDTLSTICMYVG
jgi:hypothetical protein